MLGLRKSWRQHPDGSRSAIVTVAAIPSVNPSGRQRESVFIDKVRQTNRAGPSSAAIPAYCEATSPLLLSSQIVISQFDPTLLNTFVTVAKAASFSEAGRRLGLRQSTVSQHIRRLEEAASRRLFVRDTHSVTLTADGQAMLGLAHGILEANERARQYFAVSELRGRVRFGASEDFVQSRLPEVLREFTRIHRAVDLELTVGLSGALFQALDAAELDLILAKRRPGEDRGRLVRRERLVWISQAIRRSPIPTAHCR